MRVLWIGNSHTFFHDMPELTALLYKAGTGEHMETTMLTHPGVDWEWHIEQYYELRFNLKYGHYDYCILQQVAHPFPGEETTMEFGKQLIDMCNAAGVKPIVTTTWAKKIEPENQQIMTDTYKKLAVKTGAMLSPLGEIWQAVQREYPEIELYHKDGAHASVYGAYLNACCNYMVLSGQSCVGLPNIGKDFIKDISQEKLRKQVTGIADEVDIELDVDICRKIQKIVNEVCERVKQNMQM